jgi:hypothetical protein
MDQTPHPFWGYFGPRSRSCINFNKKNGLVYILGDFFKKSSCHLVTQFHPRVTGRVTRLGEFSPLRWLLTLGSFLKITKVSQHFGFFFPRLGLFINFGLHFGRFFQKLIWLPWFTGYFCALIFVAETLWKRLRYSCQENYFRRNQGCQIFLGTKTGKIYQITKNIPNGH